MSARSAGTRGTRVFRSGKHVPRVRYIRQDTKIAVAVRDKGRCTDCGATRNLHYHHIKQFAMGGKHTKSNLRLLCSKCHKKLHLGMT